MEKNKIPEALMWIILFPFMLAKWGKTMKNKPVMIIGIILSILMAGEVVDEVDDLASEYHSTRQREYLVALVEEREKRRTCKKNIEENDDENKEVNPEFLALGIIEGNENCYCPDCEQDVE